MYRLLPAACTAVLLACIVSSCPLLNGSEVLPRFEAVSAHVHASFLGDDPYGYDPNGLAPVLELPSNVKKLHIDIGPNDSPMAPPRNDRSVAVIAVEPNVAIAHHMRETMQKRVHPSNFFVVNAAVSGKPLAGRVATFHHYNSRGASSSLARVKKDEKGKDPSFADRGKHDPSDQYGPGPAGVDFVPVIGLDALLKAIPMEVDIDILKTDAQGFDLDVIKSARRDTLRRVRMIKTETYLPGVAEKRYVGVKNELLKDWIPYMNKIGFRLVNPTKKEGAEYDAVWVRVD